MEILDFEKIKDEKIKDENERTNYIFDKIKEDYNNGLINDIVIIKRSKTNDGESYHIKYHWFGNSSLTTAMGMLDFGKMLLYEWSQGGE